ncbi:hypothetical protein KM043_015590 [Ampulex compressa]|nr:hypothetical protein KM043_015590 [Ampulex compressa]
MLIHIRRKVDKRGESVAIIGNGKNGGYAGGSVVGSVGGGWCVLVLLLPVARVGRKGGTGGEQLSTGDVLAHAERGLPGYESTYIGSSTAREQQSRSRRLSVLFPRKGGRVRVPAFETVCAGCRRGYRLPLSIPHPAWSSSGRSKISQPASRSITGDLGGYALLRELSSVEGAPFVEIALAQMPRNPWKREAIAVMAPLFPRGEMTMMRMGILAGRMGRERIGIYVIGPTEARPPILDSFPLKEGGDGNVARFVLRPMRLNEENELAVECSFRIPWR